MTMPFDTLDYAKKLEAAGAPCEQARSQSRLLADVLSRYTGYSERFMHLDCERENKTVATMRKLECVMENRFMTASSELKVLRWMMGTLLGLNIAILLKLLIG